jgi:crotonobetainyl-CoA:carnitine CoA-transferase CaiB-like acyl-CoA transferase
VLATWTGPAGAGTTDGTESSGRAEPVPGYGLFATADGGQLALGVVNEQHFWSNLCRELGRPELADLGFEERCRRGAELQHAIGASIATRARDDLVTRLVAAGVPVAPVLDRQGMLAAAPFPTFPIRLPLPGASGPVPALDQHRGEGFGGAG